MISCFFWTKSVTEFPDPTYASSQKTNNESTFTTCVQNVVSKILCQLDDFGWFFSLCVVSIRWFLRIFLKSAKSQLGEVSIRWVNVITRDFGGKSQLGEVSIRCERTVVLMPFIVDVWCIMVRIYETHENIKCGRGEKGLRTEYKIGFKNWN